jgi:hypothetical protein
MLRRSVLVMVVCAPAVARGDEWSLHLLAAATASWSDNIFSAPEEQITSQPDPNGPILTTPPVEEDFYYQVSPGALFSYEAPRMIHELTYNFEANFYQENSDARSYLHRAGWRGFFLTSPRSELTAAAQYSTGQNNALVARDASGTPVGQPGGTTDFVSADLSENYHFSITRQLRLSQSFLGRRFETKDDFNTTSTGTELGGSVGIDRSWRDNAVGLTVSPSLVLLEARVPPDEDMPMAIVSGTDSLNVQAVLSWRRDLGRRWSSLLDAGGTAIIPIDEGDQFVMQPTVGAALSYFPEWGSATVQARRSVVPNLFIAQNTITDSATASLTLPLPWLAVDPAQPRLSVRGTGGYQRTQIIDLDTGDNGDGYDVIVGDLAVEYAMSNALALSVRYQYIKQDAENDTLIETVDYTRQTAMITVYGRWPDRLAGQVPSSESLRVDRGNGVEMSEQVDAEGGVSTGATRQR